MSERVLSTRELNRALLARQLLLERSSLPLTRALEAVGGLQTQYAPSGYVGLWSRLRDFPRAALTKALVNREAIQGTLMRSTIHTVSRADYPVLLAGVRSARRDWWLRVVQHQAHGLDMDAVAGIVRERLSRGPARAAELNARRTQVMPERYRPIVFNTKTPHSMPVFLVDGEVAGTWRHEGARIHLKPFEPIPRTARRELGEEAKALAAFHAD